MPVFSTFSEIVDHCDTWHNQESVRRIICYYANRKAEGDHFTLLTMDDLRMLSKERLAILFMGVVNKVDDRLKEDKKLETKRRTSYSGKTL
jgi:hypothetical protein